VLQELLDENTELKICMITLNDMLLLEKNSNDEYSKTISLRKLPYDLNVGREYIQMIYKRKINKQLNICPLECSILWFGVNQIIKNPLFDEWTRTQEYLMENPDIKQRKRFRASYNDIYSKPFVNPYSTSPRKYYIDLETAKRLGHLCSTHKIDINYLYPIAHLYGQIFFMKALDNIPNKEVYDSIESEVAFFEEQIEEELDLKKIMYKLYSKQDDGRKILNIIQKPATIKGITTNNEYCSNKTTQTENCSNKTTKPENNSKITTQLHACITEGYSNNIERTPETNNITIGNNSNIPNDLENHLLDFYKDKNVLEYTPSDIGFHIRQVMPQYSQKSNEYGAIFIEEMTP
jgi:hypothetical protein